MIIDIRQYDISVTAYGWETTVQEGRLIEINTDLVESVQEVWRTHHEEKTETKIVSYLGIFKKSIEYIKAVPVKNYRLFKTTMSSGNVYYFNKNIFELIKERSYEI